MSGDYRHQWPLTSLEKQDSWLSGLLYHVIFFSDLFNVTFNYLEPFYGANFCLDIFLWIARFI